jgi:hypothetical protein
MGERIIYPAMIYIASGEDGFPCKIGFSQDLENRLVMMQIGNWERIVIRHAFFVLDKEARGLKGINHNALLSAARALETACHRQMKELDLHLRGEWFSVDSEDALSVLKKVADAKGFRIASAHDVLAFDPGVLIRSDEKMAWRQVAEMAAMAAEVIATA